MTVQKFNIKWRHIGLIVYTEAVVQRCSVRNIFLEISQNSQEKNLCQSLFFNRAAGLRPKACNFIKKKTLAQVSSCELCEISKNTFFTEHLWTAASEA